ncbi:ATP-binding cassette domain-containing protein [Sinorhizobium medicae]
MTTPILSARNIEKSFGQMRAMQGANFDIHEGEVVALIGDNGAGKSTLTKILSGVLQPDSGEIYIDNTLVHFDSPLDARAHGIETVYQDLSLAVDLNAVQNLYLGREIASPRSDGPPRLSRQGADAAQGPGVFCAPGRARSRHARSRR